MLGGIGGRRRRARQRMRWHHWLAAHESGWTLGVGDVQGGLACCDSWGRKESDTIEQLNWTEPYNRKIIQLGLTHSYEHIKRRVFSQLVTNRKSDIRSLKEIWVSCGSCNATEPVRLAQGITLQAECRSWKYFQTHSPQEKEALSPTTTRNWILPTNSMS